MCISSSSSNQRCPPGHYPSLSFDQGTQMEPNRNDEGCICPRQREVVKEQATEGYKRITQGKSSTLMEVTQWLTDWRPENSSLHCSMRGVWEALLFYSLNISCMPKCDHCQGCSAFILIFFLFSLSILYVDLSAFCCETTAGSMIYLDIFMADLNKIHCTGWMGDFSVGNLYTLCPKAHMIKLKTVS